MAQGSTHLIPKKQWVKNEDITGDLNVIMAPVMHRAFDAIMADYEPASTTALVSLCTSTRPYSSGRKWKKYQDLFHLAADMIVLSNGGIIPLEYEECYPYLDYDGPRERVNDHLVEHIGRSRMIKFFTKFSYDNILFNFPPTHKRHLLYIPDVAQTLLDAKRIKSAVILPGQDHYAAAQADGTLYKGFKMYPTLHPYMLLPVAQQLKLWGAPVDKAISVIKAEALSLQGS